VTAAPESVLSSGVLTVLVTELRALLPARVPAALRPSALAAILPAVLARRDLRRLGSAPGPRGLGDRLAVLTAAATGRV
jgi:phytoene synthase